MHRTLRQALIWLARRGEIDQRRKCGPRDMECRELAQLHGFHPIDERVLEDLLLRVPSVGEVYGHQTWLFLPEPKKGSLRLPILNVIYDYEKDPAQIRMQMAIFYNVDSGPLAMGWRFESPESGGAQGELSSHGFYHAQPSLSLRTKGGCHQLPLADARIPDGRPAFPLAAVDEVDLLICLLLSVYGLKEASELVSEATDPELAKRLRLCIRRPAP